MPQGSTLRQNFCAVTHDYKSFDSFKQKNGRDAFFFLPYKLKMGDERGFYTTHVIPAVLTFNMKEFRFYDVCNCFKCV